MSKDARAARDEEARLARTAAQHEGLDRQMEYIEARRQEQARLDAEAERLRVRPGLGVSGVCVCGGG